MLLLLLFIVGISIYGIGFLLEKKFKIKSYRKTENQELNEAVSSVQTRFQTGTYL